MGRYLISYQNDVDSVLVRIRDVEVVIFMSMEFVREIVRWEFIVRVLGRNLYLNGNVFTFVIFFGIPKKLYSGGHLISQTNNSN